MAKDIKNRSDLNKYFDDYRECTFKAIVDAFENVGEEAITFAREPHAGDWVDRSGNLRSSIGYMVTYNGEAVTTKGFKETPSTDGSGINGKEGAEEGKRVIKGLEGTHTEGFALIIVAGMNYAEYVQAYKDYDVLAGAELHARKEMQGWLDLVPKKIESLMKEKGW